MRDQLRALKHKEVTAYANVMQIDGNRMRIAGIESHYTHENNNNLKEVDHCWIMVPKLNEVYIEVGDTIRFKGTPRLYSRTDGTGDFSFYNVQILKIERNSYLGSVHTTIERFEAYTNPKLKGILKSLQKDLKKLRGKKGKFAAEEREELVAFIEIAEHVQSYRRAAQARKSETQAHNAEVCLAVM